MSGRQTRRINWTAAPVTSDMMIRKEPLIGVGSTVRWIDNCSMDGLLHETGWVREIKGDTAFIDCDCGPRKIWRPLDRLRPGTQFDGTEPIPKPDPC